MDILKVANDCGNSEQDMYFNGKAVSSPSVFARVGHLPKLDDVSTDYVAAHIHDELIVSVEGTIYYVGMAALRSNAHCRSITVGVDNDKVSSDIVYVNTLAHIAGEAFADAYAKTMKSKKKDLDKVINVTVDMATAIPVSYYSVMKAHEFENKFMGKEHMVTIYAGPQEYIVVISFDFVKCIPEGVTASHAFISNPDIFSGDGDVLSVDDIKKSRILHVAIGEVTTEFPITTGIAFRPEFIRGTNNGNGHAMARVLEEFKTRFGLTSVTRQDFSRYLREKDHKYHDDAMEVFMPALEDEAEDIFEMTKQVITEANNEIDVVAVYGGGSILMKDALKSRLEAYCERARIRLLYIDDPKTAVFLEAMGLDAFVHGSIFEKLKERASVEN